MNGYNKIGLLIFFILVSIEFLWPQTDHYKFRQLTTKDGLPSNIINEIIKDHDGFMWFGTGNGLSRYDGYNFINYKFPEDSVTGSKSQTVTKLLELDNDKFLIGTYKRILNNLVFIRCCKFHIPGEVFFVLIARNLTNISCGNTQC